MNKSFPIIALIALLCSWSASLMSQNPGCDGVRYKDNVFTTVTKTTVVYGPSTSHLNLPMTLSMDVYQPTGDQLTSRPVVVLAHGGSFVLGDKADMKDACERLARKGYVAASIQYRLFPVFQLGFPDSIDIFDTAVKAVGDMKAAVRYFRQDAATTNTFKVDAEHIFIGGYSAGAVTALHTGYIDLDDPLPAFLQTLFDNNGGQEGVSGTPENKTYNSASLAIINMSGGLYRKEWISEGQIPMVSIHGDADETVPYVSGLAAGIAYLEGSSLLHAHALEVGVGSSLLTVPGGGHTNIYSQSQYLPYIDTFFTRTSVLLESLTCAVVGTDPEPQTLRAWSIYPNPVTTDWMLVQTTEKVEELSVKLYDNAGKLVLEQQHVQNGSKVQIGQLAPGIYMAQLSAPGSGQEFQMKKIVRQ